MSRRIANDLGLPEKCGFCESVLKSNFRFCPGCGRRYRWHPFPIGRKKPLNFRVLGEKKSWDGHLFILVVFPSKFNNRLA